MFSAAMRRRLHHRRFTFEQLENRRLLAQLTFTNAAGGAWNVPGNWSSNSVPTAADDVQINLAADKIVTIPAGAAAAASISTTATLAVTGSLTTASIQGTGKVSLIGGSLIGTTVASTVTIVGTATGGALNSATVSGTIDLSQQSAANIFVLGGLVHNGTMLLGNTSGSTYGGVTFQDNAALGNWLQGTSTVVFGGHASNYLLNNINRAGTAGTFTLGLNVVVQGKSGFIHNSFAAGSIVNQGTINVGVSGGVFNVGNNGADFTNNGQIVLSNGTLNFGGGLTRTGLGTITRSGGVINLSGTLDLQGGEWVLNASTGSWAMSGGTVRNGTIRAESGSQLLMTTTGGSLSSITYTGTLDVSQQTAAKLYIFNGLVLNGTLLIGNASGTTSGEVYFQDNGLLGNWLTGTCTVVFGGSSLNYFYNNIFRTGAAATVTLGPQVILAGKNGYIGNNSAQGSLVSQGQINVAEAGGTLHVGYGGASFTNSGQINVSNGTLTLYSGITLTGLGTINRTGGTINLAGTLDLQGAEWVLNASTGNWNLLGGTIRSGTVRVESGTQLLMTNSGGALASITFFGTVDLSQAPSAKLSIFNGLVLNGTMLIGNAAGTTSGEVLFQDNGLLGNWLLGNCSVVFGASGSNYFYNNIFRTGSAGTLTIGSQVSIFGKNGYVGNSSNSGSIVSQGQINVTEAGGTLHVGYNGASFTNSGQIRVTNGALTLYSGMTLTGLGTIERTGGAINLAGSLDLQGGTWTLNSQTGSWNLVGGAVRNGTVNFQNGSLLNATVTGGTLASIVLNGTLDLSQQVGSNVSVVGGLVLNGSLLLGNATGSTYGQVLFKDNGLLGNWLAGTCSVVFGGNGNNALINDINRTGVAGTVTLGENVTISGKSGLISASFVASGSLVNLGKINADVAGGTLQVGYNAASFINSGEIKVGPGTLKLYSNLTLPGLGTITRNGGAIELVGNLDLQGGTWNLNATTGSWSLVGGVVRNGTITQSDGALLVMTNSSTLASITFNGTLDLSQVNVTNLYVVGGLVHNGTMLLGSSTNSNFATVWFQDNGLLGNSLTGNSTIVFGTSSNNVLLNNINRSGAAGTVTLGPNVVVQGRSGFIHNSFSNGSIVNQGTINASISAATQTLGNSTVGSFTNLGTLGVFNGANINLPSGLTLSPTASLNQSGTSSLILAGNFISAATNSLYFRPAGGINITGGSAAAPRLVEAMSQDNGSALANFSTANYLMGGLYPAANSYVRLVNQFDNSPGAGNEAVYANVVLVPAGATLDLNGLNLYTRALQQLGTVLNGTITIVPDSGPLTLGQLTPGSISVAGQVDEWTFFSRSDQQVTIVVNPGSSGAVAPQLNWANVQMFNPVGASLASVSSTVAGAVLTLPNVPTQTTGIYSVRVRAEANRPASTGNYSITAWDSTPRVRALDFNQPVSGSINTPYGQDYWNIVAQAGTQVQFDFLNASSSGITYSLIGPNAYSGFTDISGDSNLLTLPFTGTYSVVARSLTAAQGAYSFQLKRTDVVDVALNTTFNGTLNNNEARLFRVDVPAGQVLTLRATDATPTDRIEMYARLASPPTRETFDYRYSALGNDQQIVIPSAAAGSWFVLVYGASVPVASAFTFTPSTALARIASVVPERAGNALPLRITVQGAGFATGTTVELVTADGNTTLVPATQTVDSYTQITADFAQGIAPGNYSVRVRRGGNTHTLTGAIQITQGGQAQLETQLVMPQALGRRTPTTLYVEFANTGDLAMPAPLLTLQSVDPDDSDKPILSLDPNMATQNFWSANTTYLPPGTSHNAWILGSGKQPGILNPGERIRVPVYYLGLLSPWVTTDTAVSWKFGTGPPMTIVLSIGPVVRNRRDRLHSVPNSGQPCTATSPQV